MAVLAMHTVVHRSALADFEELSGPPADPFVRVADPTIQRKVPVAILKSPL